jgi:class 3 adenylate cyclase
MRELLSGCWWDTSSIEDVAFSDSEYYCVLYADMVNSTETAARIANSIKLRSFYCTFINSLSHVANSFGSKVIKTGGDSVICYFPETQDCKNTMCFKKVLECGLEMIAARGQINSKLHMEGMPAISYRVSADYGKHEVVRTSNSDVRDLVSTTMNICSKINSLALPNSMRIGSDLYEIVKSYHEFCFNSMGDYSAGLRNAYPVYAVSRKRGC